MTVLLASLSMTIRSLLLIGQQKAALFQTHVSRKSFGQAYKRSTISRRRRMPVPLLKARTSMVDGFPYKEEVGGSSPSVPTKLLFEISELESDGFKLRMC